ncbi:MAG TPA: RDD family protein [Deltaproteobacteria bacterium]|nr:RDD family protein [Deltaproteobacteria bacterium]
MHNVRYGGFWRRAIAFVIDKAILFFISVPLIVIGSLILDTGLSFDPESLMTGPFLIAYYGTTILLNMVYFTYFHGSIGQTPGKMMLGLRVVPMTGDQMTFGIAFLRWVGYIISELIVNLGFIWIAFDGRKRGWHDMIAATYVIRTPRQNANYDNR